MERRFVAKLFQNGRSQAVRLPKECRLPGTEVTITREGDRLIIEPIQTRFSQRFVERFFRRAPDPERLPDREQPGPQERPALDEL